MPDYESLEGVTYESLQQQVAMHQTISLIVIILVSSLIVFSILFGILTCYRSSKIYVNACRMRDEHALKLAGRAMTVSLLGLFFINLPLVIVAAGMVKDYKRTEWRPEEDEDEDEDDEEDDK